MEIILIAGLVALGGAFYAWLVLAQARGVATRSAATDAKLRRAARQDPSLAPDRLRRELSEIVERVLAARWFGDLRVAGDAAGPEMLHDWERRWLVRRPAGTHVRGLQLLDFEDGPPRVLARVHIRPTLTLWIAPPVAAAQLGLPGGRIRTREEWLLERGPVGWRAVGYQAEALVRLGAWGWG
jgi:hypothetical protein